jgi:hypothetical protein
MLRRLFGLASFLAGSLWIFSWEFVRSLFYERASHMLNPYIEGVTLDQVTHWGPPTVLTVVGLWLFFKTRSKAAINTRGALPAEMSTMKGQDVAADRFVQNPNEYFALSLNVSKIWIQMPRLKESLIHINIDVFNANADDIYLKGINGYISLTRMNRSGSAAKRLGNLITPSFYET